MAAYEEQQFYKNTLKAAADYSIEHQLLEGYQVELLFPAIRASQTDNIYYYEPSSGFLRPEKCIDVQLIAAKDNGAAIMLNNTVESISESKQDIRLSLQNGTTINAGKVIVATGPWIRNMLADTFEPILVCD